MNKLNLSLSIIHNQMNVNFHLFSSSIPLTSQVKGKNAFLLLFGEKRTRMNKKSKKIRKILVIFCEQHSFLHVYSYSYFILFLKCEEKLSLWIFQEFSNLPFFLIYEFILEYQVSINFAMFKFHIELVEYFMCKQIVDFYGLLKLKFCCGIFLGEY